MSFEEPKAPIVRIRKKKVKKKAKNNDVVILPVRASQNPRYSNLAAPQNPQTKSRECCRRLFAGCLKVPFCKVLCYRCILPSCYGCTGSDEEEGGDAGDEGYYSQNRRSSEILPGAEGGAEGNSGSQAVEMCEIKGETVNLIPPPRTRVNDYRRDPGKKTEPRGAVGGATLNSDDTEVTYIEVEHVSSSDDSNSNKHIPGKSDINETCIKTSTEYMEPIRKNSLEETLIVSFDKAMMGKSYEESLDQDVSDDSESQYYVNEDVLKPKGDSMQASVDETDGPVLKHYINLDNVTTCSGNNSHESIEIENIKPHEYVNLDNVDDNKASKESLSSIGPLEELKIVESDSEKENSETPSKAPRNGLDLNRGSSKENLSSGELESDICVKDSKKLLTRDDKQSESSASSSSDEESPMSAEQTTDQTQLI